MFEDFVDNILKYVQFQSVVITRAGTKYTYTNAYDIWKQIELGPEWVNSKKSKVPRKILAYKGSPEWIEFKSLVDSFNDSLQKLVDYINIHGPIYLAKLGYTFSYFLEVFPAGFVKKEKIYECLPFKINLKIPEYDTIKNAIFKPHSFLNEAKLSAMAISVRLAILSQKLKEACLKFIVLDDLLISLDMLNRERVLDLMLSPEFSDNYQLLILTHERMFYQMAKHKIRDLQQNNWAYYEMHEHREKGKSEPLIFEEVGYIGKALKFLHQNELEVAANYLRKDAEAFCKELLPNRLSLKEDGNYKDLSSLISESLKFAETNSMSLTIFKKLDKDRKFVLNPGSHDSYDVPKYRNEIEECYLNLLEARKLRIKSILKKGANLSFEVSNGVDTYSLEIVLAENLKLIKEPGADSILAKTHINYNVVKNGTKTQENVQHGIESLHSLYMKFYNWSDKAGSSSMWNAIKVSTEGGLENLGQFRKI